MGGDLKGDEVMRVGVVWGEDNNGESGGVCYFGGDGEWVD